VDLPGDEMVEDVRILGHKALDDLGILNVCRGEW
jgi:hypothetical protein